MGNKNQRVDQSDQSGKSDESVGLTNLSNDLYIYSGATRKSNESGAATIRDNRTELPALTIVGDNRVPHDASDHAGPGSLRRRKLRDQHNESQNSPAVVPESKPPHESNSREVNPRDSKPNPHGLQPRESSEREQPRQRVSPPGDGTVSEVNVKQLKSIIANSDRPVLIDVYKNGCPGCVALEPTMKNVAAQFQGSASVYRMNVIELARDPELRAQMRISAVPATFIYDGGRMVNRDVGPKDSHYYGSKLTGLLSQHESSDRQPGGARDRNGEHQPGYPSGETPMSRREKRAERREEKKHDEENDNDNHHPLSARLHKIKEKLARLTHFSHKEKEDAFCPTPEEIRTMDLINQRRRQHQLPDVVQDPRLQIIARRHTSYQMSHGMTHNENTPGWQNVSQRMSQVGLQGWRENAATGAFTPETLVQMWMDSPPHRAALLGQGNIAAVAIRGGKATFNLTTDRETY